MLEKLTRDVPVETVAELAALIPFLPRAAADALAERTADFLNLDAALLCQLGPFLSREKMDALAERVVPENRILLSGAAPFVSQAVLERLLDRTPEEEQES